jgi:thioredoxin-related protein
MCVQVDVSNMATCDIVILNIKIGSQIFVKFCKLPWKIYTLHMLSQDRWTAIIIKRNTTAYCDALKRVQVNGANLQRQQDGSFHCNMFN